MGNILCDHHILLQHLINFVLSLHNNIPLFLVPIDSFISTGQPLLQQLLNDIPIGHTYIIYLPILTDSIVQIASKTILSLLLLLKLPLLLLQLRPKLLAPIHKLLQQIKIPLIPCLSPIILPQQFLTFYWLCIIVILICIQTLLIFLTGSEVYSVGCIW